jgi:uncharacterized membrane protein
MMIRLILPIIAAIAGITFLIASIKRIAQKQTNGLLLLFTGLIALVWAIMKIIQKGYGEDLGARPIAYLDHYSSLLAGAGIALCIVMAVFETRKSKSK